MMLVLVQLSTRLHLFFCTRCRRCCCGIFSPVAATAIATIVPAVVTMADFICTTAGIVFSLYTQEGAREGGRRREGGRAKEGGREGEKVGYYMMFYRTCNREKAIPLVVFRRKEVDVIRGGVNTC